MKYQVEITETLQRTVEIDADSASEAIRKVKQLYRDEEIVLGYEDFIENNFQILK